MTNPSGFELGSDGTAPLVVGVDGSGTSWRALYYAFGIARRQNATVLAVFAVSSPIALDDDELMACATTQANDQLADELRLTIQTLAADYRVRTTFVSLVGDPVGTLIRIADEQRADALIIGASQAFIHRVLPSKAVRAVRRCRCPVIVVP
ncbi:universal stress protein [Rugosimonospora acidiphila]|uniref:Universal stress protein n=1 Tax=Rugosimonospora acidiphila TaxID=556531 RepID=A0ABP9RRA7_9ACTN